MNELAKVPDLNDSVPIKGLVAERLIVFRLKFNILIQ